MHFVDHGWYHLQQQQVVEQSSKGEGMEGG